MLMSYNQPTINRQSNDKALQLNLITSLTNIMKVLRWSVAGQGQSPMAI